MDNEAQQELAKVRAQSDVKGIKRTIKEFYRLVSPDVTGEELEAAHETFLTGLDQLKSQLPKTQQLARETESEVAQYVADAQAIETTYHQTTAKLASLRIKLANAQRDRGRTIEYDLIALDIGKLPERVQGLQSQAKLNEDITTLKEEQETYKVTWERRREEFGQIVDSLTQMSEAIAEEKMEQERRRALDDEEPAALDPTAPPFEPAGMAVDPPAAGIEGEGGEEPNGKDGEEEGEEGQEEGEQGEGTDDVVMGDAAELEEGQEREEQEDGEV